MRSKLIINQSVINGEIAKMQRGLMNMAIDITNQAKRNAPYLSGSLVNTIRVRPVNKSKVEIIAGGDYADKSVPYAAVREKTNKAHPWTTRYMGRAFDEASNNYSKYFGGKK